MIVRAPEERFPTAPEGSFAAVCVDEIDLGMVPNRFDADKPRNMVRLVWQIAEDQDDGTPHKVRQDYTASLHEKAKLRKDLQAWRGRAFTPEELSGFDLENVVGVSCLLSITHNTGSKGGVFANIGGVMKLPKGMTAPVARDYIRVRDRPAAPAAVPALVSQPKQRPVPLEEQPPDASEYDRYHGITDDDVPF